MHIMNHIHPSAPFSLLVSSVALSSVLSFPKLSPFYVHVCIFYLDFTYERKYVIFLFVPDLFQFM
jgi:hypothetical protein